MFAAKNISYSVKNKLLLNSCSISCQPGTFTAIVGANGAGKTTLQKILSGEYTGYTGEITINNINLSHLKSRDLSLVRSVLPQHSTLNFPFNIEQVIEIGRYPHYTKKAENERIIEEVIELTGLSSLRGRVFQTLSGGEQQRVQMARVICQIWDNAKHPKYLLLDEPTSSLDMAHQHNLLDLARSLFSRSVGIIAILHDLNLAAHYADSVLFLKEGKTIAYGPTHDVMTEDIIEETFTHPVKVSYDNETNKPFIRPLPINRKSITSKQIINNYEYEQLNA